MAGLILIFILNFCVLICNGQDSDTKSKSALIAEVIEKISNITFKSFANIPVEKRETLTVQIEEKLKKSAKSLGISKRYVSTIMDAIKSIGSKHVEHDDLSSDSDIIFQTPVRSGKEKSAGIAQKIMDITPKSVKYGKTPEDRGNIIRTVQKKVIDAAIKNSDIARRMEIEYIENKKNKDVIHDVKKSEPIYKKDPGNKQIDKLKNTAKKVMEIVEKSLNNAETSEDRRLIINNIKQKINDLLVKKKRQDRRVEIKFNKKIDVKKNVINLKLANSTAIKSENDINSKQTTGQIVIPPTNVTLATCHDKNKHVCLMLKRLRTINCNSQNLSIEKLCNGINECFDDSDERDCAVHGIDKVRDAREIMSNIENIISANCHTNVDDSLIAKQNDIMNSVLQSQLQFIQKYSSLPSNSSQRKSNTEPIEVRTTVNELAEVIKVLSVALESTLCTSFINVRSRKFNEIENDIVKESEATKSWVPKSCKCDEEYCIGKCSVDCDQICIQRYNLGRWHCKAVTNKQTIPLDLICDGKLDCYDEKDEKGCSNNVSGPSIFEAGNMYSYVVDMIKTRITKAETQNLRSKFMILQKLIEKLQKLTRNRSVDLFEVKDLREECFSRIVAIYDDIKLKASSMLDMNESYIFLMSISDKLVNALKHSHIGNVKVMKSDRCLCRNNDCLLQDCSNVCRRACQVESKLTQYFCGGSVATDHSIPIEAICNGKADCPHKDDEAGCVEDICRKHHLVVLNHNLTVADEVKTGTTVGEALKLWTSEVTSTVQTFDSTKRPTPMILRHVVKAILHDLVMTYANLPPLRRRSDDDIVEQFYKMARIVMNTMKSCSK